MTDFQVLDAAFLSQGWERRKGRGDHYHYKCPGGTVELMVSMRVSGREVHNVISRARRQQPTFTCSLNPLKKADKPLQAALSALTDLPALSPMNKVADDNNGHFILKKDLAKGDEVRYSAGSDWDYSKMFSPDEEIAKKYVITKLLPGNYVEIQCGKVKRTVHLRDIDSYELVTCSKCGKLLPATYMSASYSYKCRCKKCSKAKADIEESAEDPVLFIEPQPKVQEPEDNAVINVKSPADILFDIIADVADSLSSQNVRDIINEARFDIRQENGKYTVVLNSYCDISAAEMDELIKCVNGNFTSPWKVVTNIIQKPIVQEKPVIKKETSPEPPKESPVDTSAAVMVNREERIKELLASLKDIVAQLGELGVSVKIRKIRYAIEEEIVIKKVRKVLFKL